MNEKIIYNQITEQIDDYISKQTNCCKIGCSHCCFQLIETIHIERESIREFVINKTDETQKKIIKKNLAKWLDFFDSNTANNRILDKMDIFKEFRDLSILKKEKCPFLIENKCSIYEKRPIACRLHIVEHSPELCKIEPYRDSSQQIQNVRMNLIIKLKTMMSVKVEPLPYVVADIFLPQRKLKPIKELNL